MLGVLALTFGSSPAGAEWPPPESATDLSDPKYWPNDPGYPYKASAKPKERESGAWQFFSFIPERSPGEFVPPLRPGETASGMSVDLAWRHTIGDDRIVIAVIDSGIKWDDADLIYKAYLNIGELATHLPTHLDKSACAILPPPAPPLGFDCDGDGIVTVKDYEESGTLLDENQNGRLDAGDLILAYSDGIDDDGNGYTDDISGWDFFKDDNDPYDDTRYGHGTGEAGDSTAETNNGIGDAGICPKCRFVALRAGDSFITDSNDFAQAVIYATDNGVKVVQEALGTINMSAYAQQAMDYAWDKGTVIVASMADENSRHHNYPATANHTMPVHAITMLGDEQSTTAKSFLAFNTCTNFGAQNFLSASGTGCSSEATGKLSGIAGLVYAMGLTANLDPPLNAGEVLQIFTMTADDINIPESQQPDSIHFWSQEGFDQRFGYGRVNANTAVEWVKQAKIPPEVDITSPLWFEVLYKDRVTQAVPIVGTVRARRAPHYSVFVEWAPGVQPLDEEFSVIKKVENINSSEVPVFGLDEPLATLDPRDVDTTHEPDIDSPHGENERTITVRVRAVAHYGGELGDVPGELRRAYAIHEDEDLMEGFPYYLGASAESSPKLADIDGDGVRDVVIGTSDGKLHVLTLKNGKPEEVKGFPFLVDPIDGLNPEITPSYLTGTAYTTADEPETLPPEGIDPATARESISPTPAIADLDGDDKLDIVVTTYPGTIYAIKNDGTALPGWPVRLPKIPSCPLDAPKDPNQPCMDTDTRITRGAFGSPVIEDMDADGQYEIVQAAFDGKVYIYEIDGSPMEGWPVLVHFEGGDGSGEYNRVFTTPAVGDMNGDGIPDVLTGSSEKLGKAGGSGAFYVIDGRGTKAGAKPYLPGWPVTTVSLNLFPLVAEGVSNSPVMADMDGDGKPEGIMHGNASPPYILPEVPGTQTFSGSTPTNAMPIQYDEDGNEIGRGVAPTSLFGPGSLAEAPDTMFPLFAQPAIGDLDQDGVPDVTASGGSLSMAQTLLSSQPKSGAPAQHLLAMWNGKTGSMLPSSPILLEDFTFFNNQAIADLTNDGYPEVLVGTGGYFVHAADACGREPTGWPKFVGGWVTATTAIGDIDADQKLDVVIGTRAGWLFAWKSEGRAADSVVSWESFHHDNRNTGNYSTPLEQGKYSSGVGPLPLDKDGKCIQAGDGSGKIGIEDLDATGGCNCNLSRESRTNTPLWLALGLLGAAARLRRRRP
jgi:MYXO-CTERM domain-containing protein